MKETNLIALDVGKSRIGVARANAGIGFPSPLITIKNDNNLWANLRKIIEDNSVVAIVVGIPRSLNGKNTEQTEYTLEFIRELSKREELPIIQQDEALTSKKAEDELSKQKKPRYDVDSLAATYILEDYLNSQHRVKNV